MFHTVREDAPRSRLVALRRLSFLTTLSDAELRHVDALTCEVDVEPGTAFIKQGQIGREAFVVTAGEADVAIDGVSVARIGPGEVLGEMALLADAPRSATVTALTPMRVLVMDRGQFADLVRDPHFAKSLFEVELRRRGTTQPHLVR